MDLTYPSYMYTYTFKLHQIWRRGFWNQHQVCFLISVHAAILFCRTSVIAQMPMCFILFVHLLVFFPCYMVVIFLGYLYLYFFFVLIKDWALRGPKKCSVYNLNYILSVRIRFADLRKINRTTTFHNKIYYLTPESSDILKILWERGEIAP